VDTLLSIDLGTTGCKGALFSTDGRLLGSHYVEYPLIHCGPGCVEQDASQWWALSVAVMRSAVSTSGIDRRSVRAVGISTQGISFVPVDRSGAILRNAICWLDSRATLEAWEIEERIGEVELFRLTGKRPGAVYVLPKLLWLRRHEPDLFRSTDKFLMAHDVLIRRLCDESITDYSMAGGSMLLDVQKLDWCDMLLDTFEVDRRKLPDLAWSGTVAGELSDGAAGQIGLPQGIPIVVGGQDQKCAALGVAIREGVATVSLGTASAISSVSSRPILDAERRIPTFPFVQPGRWDLEGVVGTAGAALKWVRDTMFPGDTYSALDALAAYSQPGAGGVCFHPYLEGAASPWWNLDERGAFSGMSLATARADIVRSVLEGVAYEIRANVEVLGTMTDVRELVLFGGGARSPIWTRIIAEVCGLPVRIAHLVDVANWGACVLAGTGAGLFPAGVASPAIDLLSSPIVPDDAAVRQYESLYGGYIEARLRLMDHSP
jgi:xylulokinase